MSGQSVTCRWVLGALVSVIRVGSEGGWPNKFLSKASWLSTPASEVTRAAEHPFPPLVDLEDDTPRRPFATRDAVVFRSHMEHHSYDITRRETIAESICADFAARGREFHDRHALDDHSGEWRRTRPRPAASASCRRERSARGR